MKKMLVTLALLAVYTGASAQKVVYTATGKKKTFSSEEVAIEFSDIKLMLPAQSAFVVPPALLTVLPALVDAGFRLTGASLEKRVKKFTAEYVEHKTHTRAVKGAVPFFTFKRMVTLEGSGSAETALEISFRAYALEELQGFVYYVDAIHLAFSAAKATSSKNTFDYIIELKPTFLLANGTKQVQELSPIVISSVRFGNNPYDQEKHMTDLLVLPAGATLAEIAIKVIETNPAKARAEQVLATWNNNQDNLKTIIHNYLPAGKEEDGAGTGKGAAAGEKE